MSNEQLCYRHFMKSTAHKFGFLSAKGCNDVIDDIRLLQESAGMSNKKKKNINLLCLQQQKSTSIVTTSSSLLETLFQAWYPQMHQSNRWDFKVCKLLRVWQGPQY